MASTGVEGDASPGLPVGSQPATVALFPAATVREMAGKLFLGLPLSEWKRRDAVGRGVQSSAGVSNAGSPRGSAGSRGSWST